MKINGRLIVFTLILVVLATTCKYFFAPELAWSGFSPVIAIALFSGMIIKERNVSFLLPLLALFLSDMFIEILHRQGMFDFAGFYPGQWRNYLLLLSATLVGWAFKGRSFKSLFAGAVVAPTVFFLLSNFGVWMGWGFEAPYTKDFNGLMECYAAGLPFYRNALVGTLVFLPMIVFVYNYFTKHSTRLTLA
jgi:hypothetical protein